MTSEARITMTAIFFTRILGRVQFNKIQSPLKEQSKKTVSPKSVISSAHPCQNN
ncbi:hypothetical protein [Streptococcus pantholopis]